MREPEVLISDAHGLFPLPRCWVHGQPPAMSFPNCILVSLALPDRPLPLLFLSTRPGLTAAFLNGPQRTQVQLNMPPESAPPPVSS